MKDDASGGDSNFSVPPPVSGLGNYKGVMLCNRPPDGPVTTDFQQKPFLSRIPETVGDALGLNRKRPDHPEFQVKNRGPSAALRRHCRWVKELQAQVKEDQILAEEEDEAIELRKQKMKEAFKKQRDAVRMIKASAYRPDPQKLEAALNPKAKKSVGASAQKPAWAMTHGEREEFEDSQASDLIEFAENLDFDEYIQDLEFRECLALVKDRAAKLQREQDAFKDALLREFNEDDNNEEAEKASQVGSLGGHERYGRSRAGGDGRPDWDGSTECGDLKSEAGSEVKSLSELAWKEGGHHLKGVHSKSSVKRLAERIQREAAQIDEE